MIKILVVDDHAFLRRGLKEVLENEFAPATIVEEQTGHGAIEAIRKQQWDAVVLDINLPDKSGVEVLKEIKAFFPTLPVMMLTLYPEEQYAMRVLKAGASGYLTKESEPEEFIVAMRKVLGGGTYVSSTFSEHLVTWHFGTLHSTTAPHHQLSDRELEVLVLIGQGKSLGQISDMLSLSVKTIGTYQTRIKEKLHLDTTASLVRYAIKQQLVE